MPSSEIWPLLIRKATQIKDPISELNYKECKTDPRKIEENQKEETKMMMIND